MNTAGSGVRPGLPVRAEALPLNKASQHNHNWLHQITLSGSTKKQQGGTVWRPCRCTCRGSGRLVGQNKITTRPVAPRRRGKTELYVFLMPAYEIKRGTTPTPPGSPGAAHVGHRCYR